MPSLTCVVVRTVENDLGKDSLHIIIIYILIFRQDRLNARTVEMDLPKLEANKQTHTACACLQHNNHNQF